MARVELPDGILAIHGRLGNMIYRSYKQPDGTYKVFVHEVRRREKSVIYRKRTENGPKTDRQNTEGYLYLNSHSRATIASFFHFCSFLFAYSKKKYYLCRRK